MKIPTQQEPTLETQDISVDRSVRKDGDDDPEVNKKSFRIWLKHWTGMDRAILYSVMTRLWATMTGLVTLLLIARYLTPSEQGYYYTFSSLVALQIVFELGFSFVILQLAAHERAQLSFLPQGKVMGDAVAHSRLASILQKAVRWYSVAGILMTAILLPTGFWFFGGKHNSDSLVAWALPWCLLVTASMLAFQIDPVFSFLEGCGFVAEVARRRLVQAILGSGLSWLALLAHHGLYAPAMVILGQVTVGLIFLFLPNSRRLLKGLLTYPTGAHRVGWRDEIFPFQWRIAVSWICGYFIYQVMNPILFKFQGPVAAGQMGMSLAIAGSIGAVALAWMSTKASPFGSMVARRDYANLDRLFFRTFWQSIILLGIGEVAFLVVLIGCEHSYPKLAMRVLAPWSFALLFVVGTTSHISFCQATYLRAHKREPFLLYTVVGSFLTACTTLVMARYFGINGVVVGNFVLAVLYGLPVGTYIFITKRREWRAEATGGGRIVQLG
jgi:hypothetical protein